MNYKSRRKKTIDAVPVNSIIILQGEVEKIRNNDVHYKFRQNSNFYYLSGCNEPNAKIVLVKTKNNIESLLFKKGQTALEKVWEDHKLSFEEEKKVGNWDRVLDLEEFEEVLKSVSKGVENVYLDLGDFGFVRKINEILPSAKNYSSICETIERQRALKSVEELDLIRKAVSITKEALGVVLEDISKKGSETLMNAQIEYVFAKNDVDKAYSTIVAGGNNGNILHYTKNNEKIKEGSMVLVDVGCEYGLYASDITRTLPSSGKYTEAQKELYNAVLDVQKVLIKNVKPGVTFKELNGIYVEEMVQRLVKMEILQGTKEEVMESETYKKYCPHSVGHWLGLDVHDRNPYLNIDKTPVKFEKNMVLTVEPGVYIDQKDRSVPKKYRGMAIRIEDDVLVTEKGCEVLSAGIPKEVADIEKAAQRV